MYLTIYVPSMDDLAHLHDYAPCSRNHKCVKRVFLNFVFSSTAVSTPSQSAPRGSEAVSEWDNNAHGIPLPSGDYRSVSTARPPPISGHLGENTVPTFGDENGDSLSTSAPGSGVHARRKTQLEI